MESPRYPLHFRRNPGHNRPPNGTQDVFEAGKGDVIFAPQGHYHYFENASATEELVALIVFNSDAAEPKDDIGIGRSLTAIPNVVLSAVLNVPVSVSEQIPTVGGRIVIVKRPEGQTGGQTVRIVIEPFVGEDFTASRSLVRRDSDGTAVFSSATRLSQ